MEKKNNEDMFEDTNNESFESAHSQLENIGNEDGEQDNKNFEEE